MDAGEGKEDSEDETTVSESSTGDTSSSEE